VTAASPPGTGRLVFSEIPRLTRSDAVHTAVFASACWAAVYVGDGAGRNAAHAAKPTAAMARIKALTATTPALLGRSGESTERRLAGVSVDDMS
jgi:hypothetical protein